MRTPRKTIGLLVLIAGLVAAPRVWAIDGKTVHFVTSDKQTIVADYYAPMPSKAGAPMAILLHMYRSDRSAWQPLIPLLHDAGFAILAIDMRGHGDSATERTRAQVVKRDPAVFEAMYDDVRAAYDWLAVQEGVDRSRFALVGASVGCSVALRYAAGDRSVDAIVCLSPGENYLGLDSKADMRKIKGRRIWLVAAEDQRERRGVEALAPLSDHVETKLIPGKLHGTRMFGRIPHIEQNIADFLKNNVGEPTTSTVYGSIRSKVYHLSGSEWIDKISPHNLRYYSSAAEAESRGLRKARSRGPKDSPRSKHRP